MGGGKYEYQLVAEKEITEPIQSVVLLNEEYGFDDFIIICSNIKGSNSAEFKVHFKVGDKDIYNTMTNVISETTARNYHIILERLTPGIFKYTKLGYYTGQTPSLHIVDVDDYESKITKIDLYTNIPNKFNEGTVQIYGRRRIIE